MNSVPAHRASSVTKGPLGIPALAAGVLLLAALLFGGGVRGTGDWIVYAVTAMAAGVLVWGWNPRDGHPWTRVVDAIILATLAVCVLQLLPLPLALTTAGGERAAILAELRVAGVHPEAMAISLDRWASVRALLAAGTFATLWGLTRHLSRADRIVLVKGVLVVAVLLAAVGIAQAIAKPDTTGGHAFFTSRNHFATLLAMLVPFSVAAACSGAPANGPASRIGWYGVAGTLVLAVAFTYSRTGVVLVALALTASLWGIVWPRLHGRRARLLASGVVAGGAVAVLLLSADRLAARFSDGLVGDLRWQYFARSAQAVADYFPWGSGVGTFAGTYERNEAVESLLSPAWGPGEYIFALYAHNEPLQVGIEAGLPGLGLMLAFLAVVSWGIVAAFRAGGRGDSWRCAAAIAVAMPLLHSLVDSPLRTLACSAVLALGLSLLAMPRQEQRAVP
ncbi:O-antigen ligase family protein [Luteimonas vadosa]|uniref:O-antigen ligase-related domain-containing protein n=1 Tax=Luteimonas vadosa TaxID=1165507 RepID=A0ABP9DRE2_9GAMM